MLLILLVFGLELYGAGRIFRCYIHLSINVSNARIGGKTIVKTNITHNTVFKNGVNSSHRHVLYFGVSEKNSFSVILMPLIS